MKVAILMFDGFNELDSFIAAGIPNPMKSKGWSVQITSPTPRVPSTKKQLIGDQCIGALILFTLGLLKNLPACTYLTTKPWRQAHSVDVLEQASYAKDNIATAGGCLAFQYLAAWILVKVAAESALQYVTPVGEKLAKVAPSLSMIKPDL